MGMAAGCICALCESFDSNKVAVRECDGLKPLIELLEYGNVQQFENTRSLERSLDVQLNTAKALAQLAENAENKALIRVDGDRQARKTAQRATFREAEELSRLLRIIYTLSEFSAGGVLVAVRLPGRGPRLACPVDCAAASGRVTCSTSWCTAGVPKNGKFVRLPGSHGGPRKCNNLLRVSLIFLACGDSAARPPSHAQPLPGPLRSGLPWERLAASRCS